MPKEEKVELEGEVVEALPNAMFRVKLDNMDRVVLGHVAGKMRRFRIRILPGDRVRVELSPYDLERMERVLRSGASPGPAGCRIVRWLGDDAAVVRASGYAVTSIDMLVDGVHFRSGQLSCEEIGHRALGSALSDLAAMGAAPGEAYL